MMPLTPAAAKNARDSPRSLEIPGVGRYESRIAEIQAVEEGDLSRRAVGKNSHGVEEA